MKKATVLLFSVFLILVYPFYCFSVERTFSQTPVDEASVLFTKKLGSGYRNAPTPPACCDGYLYVAAGNTMYKLNASSGEIVTKMQMESVSTYTAVPPLVVDQMVYMPLDDGIVQAFSAVDLSPVWTYHDSLGGQSLSPVIFVDGCLYTGFWNGETDDADFVCLPAAGNGEQKAIWTFSSKGGFYRIAAQQYDRFLVIGSENGERVDRPDAPSDIYVLDRFTGKTISSVPMPGDVRAGIGFDPVSKAFYAVSKAGSLCRFFVDELTGAVSAYTYYTLPGSSTITPLLYNGRLYTACSEGRNGSFLVMDANDLHLIYSAVLPGVPQGDFLLSTAYEELYGKILVYTTYNAPPGGIYVFEDNGEQTEPSYVELFAPPDEMSQYCFCPITAGADGALYYKNDSGYIFALAANESKTESHISVFQTLIDFIKKLMLLRHSLLGWFGS